MSKRRRFARFAEPLEPRLALAGDVSAEVRGGDLIVTGDAESNALTIRQTGPGRFVLAGIDGTTLNGQADPITLVGVTQDVRIRLAGGDDQLRLNESFPAGTIAVGGDLQIDGGTGFNAVEAFGNLRVGGDLRIANREAGSTQLSATLSVAGDLSIANGSGFGSTLISPSSFANNTVRGQLQIRNGAGSHFNTVEDTNVGGDAIFDNAGDAGSFSFNSFNPVDSTKPLRVGGDLRLMTRKGGSSDFVSRTNVGNEVIVAVPSGSSFLNLDQVVAGGDVRVLGGDGGASVRIGQSSTRGGLNVTTGTQADRIELVDVGVRGPVAIASGAEADEVIIDDFQALNTFTLSTGDGDDRVRIETEADNPTFSDFRRAVSIILGLGDDSLILGSIGDPERAVTFRASPRLDGGLGDDLIDPANVTNPPTPVRFEREVPKPPLVPTGRYAVGEYVLATVTADFDGDGRLDLATANGDSETISVLINRGDGEFLPAVEYEAGRNPSGLSAADLDSDGRADLVAANNTGPNGTVSVFLNNGDGTFAPRVPLSAGVSLAVAAVAIGDLDGDGFADVVTANRTGNNAASVSVFFGQGDGTLATPTVYALGQINGGNDVTLGDLDGDGDLDLVASALRGLGVLTNQGDSTFSVRVESRSVLSGVDLADLDGDGELDLIAQANGLQVEIGNGDGTFDTPIRLLEEGTMGVAVGDFDGDGTLDLAVAHFPEAGGLFLNRGDGTFAEAITFPVGPDEGPLAAGDFDLDGWLDLAVGNQEAESVTVLRNRGAF